LYRLEPAAGVTFVRIGCTQLRGTQLMPELSTILLVIYGVGALIALIRTDAGPATRLGLAALWPLGPLAFVVTLGVLLLAALVPLSGLTTRRSS
jgi:hypothetical protein